MDLIAAVLVPLAIAFIAALPGMLALKRQKKLSNATAANELAEAASRLVVQYEARMDDMEQETVTLKARTAEMEAELIVLKATLNNTIAETHREIAERDALIGQLLNGIKRLISQLQAHELVPVWGPK